MSRKRQIWYRKGSAAASLAESVKDTYELRLISPDDSKDALESKASEALRVFLVDIEKESPDFLRHIRLSGSHTRIVGVLTSPHNAASRSAVDGRPIFVYMSPSAAKQEIE